MYLGRIVAAGMTASGMPVAAYRVSSRSFPNRTASISGRTVSIIPRKGFESDLAKNPYIAYNCIRFAHGIAVATNGSHTDPITEKILSGMSMRDSFALSLLALDFEKDSLDTPRIAAAVDPASGTCAFGIVRRDAVLVNVYKLQPGIVFYLSTYEKNAPSAENRDSAFDCSTASDVCARMIRGGVFANFDKPVTAAAALWNGKDFELAAADAD